MTKKNCLLLIFPFKAGLQDVNYLTYSWQRSIVAHSGAIILAIKNEYAKMRKLFLRKVEVEVFFPCKFWGLGKEVLYFSHFWYALYANA